MENSVNKMFSFLEIVAVAIAKVLVRIPLFIIISVYTVFGLLIVEPLLHLENPKWVNNLYDWYCGK